MGEHIEFGENSYEVQNHYNAENTGKAIKATQIWVQILIKT